MGRIQKVREKDGTLSPYRERKVAESIHRALRESGSDDRALADELAGVVSLFLERTHQDSEPPKVVDIQDTVERVLRETGNEPAARRFRKVRREREELRDQIVVRGAVRRTAEALDPTGDGPAAAANSAWSRSRLVHSLQESAELPGALAEEVASEVEKKLFGLGLKSLSSDLVRHLVECELFERGIETGERASERVPISVRSLTDDLFAPRDATRGAPEAAIAAAVLEHFALSELHGAAVSEAHARGIVHVHALDRPLAIERLDLPWRLAVREGAAGARGLLDLSRTLARLRPHVAGAIALVDAVPRVLSESGGDPRAVDDLLDVVAELGPVEIAVPAGAGASVVGRIAVRAAALPEGALRVRFSVAGPDAADDEAALASIFELLRRSPFACLDLEPAAGPPAGRDGAAEPLGFSLARVTLNLPLLLADAMGESGKEALAGLDRGAAAALEAFRERAWAQRKGPKSGLPAIALVLGGPGRVVVPASGQEVDLEVWGLGHALDLLVRRGVCARAAAPEMAARILGRVLYPLGEEKDGVQLRPRLSGCTSRPVRKRMLTACEKTARRLAIRDLLEELRNERASEGALPSVAPLADRKNRALLSSHLVLGLGFGLGLPEACLPAGPAGASVRAVRELTRLRSLHLAPPGCGEPFEVQEELFE